MNLGAGLGGLIDGHFFGVGGEDGRCGGLARGGVAVDAGVGRIAARAHHAGMSMVHGSYKKTAARARPCCVTSERRYTFAVPSSMMSRMTHCEASAMFLPSVYAGEVWGGTDALLPESGSTLPVSFSVGADGRILNGREAKILVDRALVLEGGMAVAGEMDDIGVLLHDGDDIAARSLAIVAVPFGRGIRSALDLMMREQNDRRITVCEVPSSALQKKS